MTGTQPIPDLLEEFADRLDAKGVEYKPRAYRRAAEQLRDTAGDIETLAAEEDGLEAIDGVGDAIASKIREYLETGEIEELNELRSAYPIDIGAITNVEGVGPKTAGKLYDALGIETLDDLEVAAEAGEIQEVSGFGAKTESNILENIPFARKATERQLLGVARPYGERLVAYLDDSAAVAAVELGGSLRRWQPTIGDVDVLVGSEEPAAVVDAFTAWPDADSVIEAGETKASLRADEVRIDLRVVDPVEFGSALQYFTGSRAHNVAARKIAIDQELKMNEYGLFDVSDVDGDADQRAGTRVAGETEASMYERLGMAWIPPELRADRGELAAAQDDALPDLVDVEAIRGDMHTHTDWSDGRESVGELVAGAAAFGHDYLCITDHATGPGMVGGVGLSEERLREQIDEVERVAAEADISVFTGVEANIASDGSLSVGTDRLAELDCVVASPHAALDGEGTERLISAVSNPEVDILGHPTGRKLHQREGMDVDVDALAAAAAEADTALEVNANPARLDLWGSAVKTAIEAGATVVINTDAHGRQGFENVRYGVHTARRGWATAGDILNTRSPAEIRTFLDA
jgi:DNA polymerase (family 10)